MTEIIFKGLNEKVYYDECLNGLKVYMWVNKKVNTFYGTLSVKYGSIYKDFKVGNKTYHTPYGIAHFLEHIKFNERDGSTAQDYFQKTGCDTNAFTTFEYTNYQVFGTSNVLDNINHLLDFVEDGYFTKKMVKNEKGIIIEEARSSKDNPYTMLHFNLLGNLFKETDYKQIITGDENAIKSITYDDILLVYNTFYHPENMFLIVTGNFNPYELMASIKDNQSKKEYKKFIIPERIVKKDSKKVYKKYEDKKVSISSKKIKMGIKIPSNSLKEYDEVYIKTYINILLSANYDNTSEFLNDLLDKELINNLTYYFEKVDDYYLIILTVETNYEEEVLELINNKLDNISIDEKTFNRKKKSNIACLVLDYENVEYVNDVLQYQLLNYNKVVDNYKEIYENLEYKDILNFINKLNLKERSILVYSPK